MSSGRFTTITLDPFYQQFLRGWFLCKDPIFTFPKAHDLLMRLQVFLTKPPDSYIPQPASKDQLMIEIPFMEHKNVDVYNYISPALNQQFIARIREFFNMHFHERIAQLRKKHFLKEECIDIFMEENLIDPQYRDRLTKNYQRYIRNEYMRKYRKKKEKNLSVNSLKKQRV